MTIDELIAEAAEVREHFWFIQSFKVTDRTDATVTLHFVIAPDLFVQIFFSQRSRRCSLTLASNAGGMYRRDREHGIWHRHPFEQPDKHELTPEGMSITQFLAEVGKILIENDLI